MTGEEYGRLIIALAPAAAVGVFMMQPLMRFVRPMSMLVSGEVLVSALVLGAFFAVFTKRRGLHGMQVILILVATIFIFVGALLAVVQSSWNERRCVRLQTEMLNPDEHSRTDLATVFQALGCQPSGSEPADLNYRPSRFDPPSWEEEEKHDRFVEKRLAAELPLKAKKSAATLANDLRCLEIQLDMLSARPRRRDGPDLFQALGCRPQGEGRVSILPAQPDARSISRQ